MSRYFIYRISHVLNRLEQLLPQIFRQNVPPTAAAFVVTGHLDSHPIYPNQPTTDKFSLKQLIGDGILWAVPKHRRSVEKRLKRKFGHPDFNWKPLKLKTNLRTCNTCGHDHEVGVLCPHCYDKVRQETQQMQDKIQEDLGLQPVEQDVVVLYEGEKAEQPKEFFNGKRIVEMPKPRPMWFSKNLLQKSTQQPSDSKEVKPIDLA